MSIATIVIGLIAFISVLLGTVAMIGYIATVRAFSSIYRKDGDLCGNTDTSERIHRKNCTDNSEIRKEERI